MGTELQGREEYAASLVQQAAAAQGIDPASVLGPRKEQRYVETRWAVMLRLHDEGWGLAEIGHVLGRDHSTVHSAIKRAAARRRVDSDFRDLCDGLPDREGLGVRTERLIARLHAIREDAARVVALIDSRLADIESRRVSPLIVRAS